MEMNIDYYKQYEPIFGSWYIKELLGEGSFGKVYEIEREDLEITYKAALKVITIPQSQSEIKSIMADGMDEVSITEYYMGFVRDIAHEFELMSKMKGNSTVVSYEDHQVIKHKDGIGWDILIRMELLTPLFDYVKNNIMTRKDVIQLGIDICKALELCQKYNIIHRDIKPENIFVSENGDYKLGDFGIARTLEQTSGLLSKKGTQAYMAPEIYREESYGSNVDIYSLGIVMYRMLNDNRTPFLPAYPAPITHNDREMAIKKRISGAKLPVPKHADGRLAEIVLKACSFKPKDRYFSPQELRGDLEAILYNREESKIIYPAGDEAPTPSNEYISTEDQPEKVLPEDVTETPFTEQSDETDETESEFGQGEQERNLQGEDIQDKDITVSDFGTKDELNSGDPAFEESDLKLRIKWITRIGMVILLASVLTVGIGIAAKTYFNNQNVQEVAITDISVPEDCVSAVGNLYYLPWNVEPENATEKITFQSENPQIAEIDENGMIHTMSAGITMILVRSEAIQKEVKLTVLEEPIDGTALAEQFRQAQQYLQSVLESPDIDQANVALETKALGDILSQYDIESISGQDLETLLKNQTAYQEQVLPAVENLETAYTKAVEIEQNKQEAKESSGGTATTSQSTNGSVQKKTRTSTSTNTGSNTNTSTGSNNSTQDTNTPAASVDTQVESKEPEPQSEPEPQPTCPVCGSKYHSVHPSSDAPTITKEFD